VSLVHARAQPCGARVRNAPAQGCGAAAAGMRKPLRAGGRWPCGKAPRSPALTPSQNQAPCSGRRAAAHPALAMRRRPAAGRQDWASSPGGTAVNAGGVGSGLPARAEPDRPDGVPDDVVADGQLDPRGQRLTMARTSVPQQPSMTTPSLAWGRTGAYSHPARRQP
jgi:hypothetical protein